MSFQKTSMYSTSPHRGKCKLTPLPLSDVLIIFIIRNKLSSTLPPDGGRQFLLGAAQIFSGMTQYFNKNIHISAKEEIGR
jgi:hypothetical protein